jgi:hypothetical protein
VDEEAPKGTGIGWSRLLLAHCVVAVLVGGSLWALVADRELWPFSPYPMYSGMVDESLSRLRPYGVAAGGEEVFLGDPRYLGFMEGVFDAEHLHWTFLNVARREEDPEAERRRLREAARFAGARYEELRLRGRHDGPPLRAVRLYQERRNLGTGDLKERRLILKARLRGGS